MKTNRESKFLRSSPLKEVVDSISVAPLDATAVERVRQRARQLSESTSVQTVQRTGVVSPIEPRQRASAKRVGLVTATLLLAGLGVVWLTGDATVMAQVAKALRHVTSASYTVTQRVGGKADEITKVSLRDGISRAERPDGEIFVFDPKRKRLLQLNPATKSSIQTEGATLKSDFDITGFFSDLSKYSAKVQPAVADREFGGIRAKGFVVDATGVEYNVWVDPDTNLPLHFEFERKQKIHDADGRESEVIINETWSDFRFNEKLDEALFGVDSPSGYTVEIRRFENRAKQAEGQQRRAEEELKKAEEARKKKS